MDLINNLQAYKEELVELANKSEYHKASEISFLIDKVDLLIKAIVEFEQ